MIAFLSYIVSLIVHSLVNRVMLIVAYLPTKPLVDINKKFQYVISFVYAILAGFLGSYCYIILADNSIFFLSYFMLLLPALIFFISDQNRISKAKRGTSGVKTILEANMEPESYIQNIDIRNEQICCYSRVLGYLLAILLFMSNEPFL